MGSRPACCTSHLRVCICWKVATNSSNPRHTKDMRGITGRQLLLITNISKVKLSISVGRLSLCYGHGLALYWHPVKTKCICICILHATSFRNRGHQKEADVSLCIQIGVKYFIAWLFLMALQYRSSLSNHTFTGLAC